MTPKTTVKDHLGNEFPSMRAMAEHYGLRSQTLISRLKRGMALEKALEIKSGDARSVKDHTGKKFVSQEAMCRAWGIRPVTYAARIKRGWTMEQALTERNKVGRVGMKTDHLGNEFPSLRAMCAHYGTNTNSFLSRIEKGMSIEDALQIKQETVMIPCRDWLGNEYRSHQAMASALRVNMAHMKYWINKKNLTPEEASVMACGHSWPGLDVANYHIRECIEFPWFLCEDMSDPTDAPHAGELVLHAGRIAALLKETRGGTAGSG